MSNTRFGIGLPVVALPLALVVAMAWAAPGFVDWQNARNFTGQTTALLLVTLGQLLVTLVGGIDLSVGSVMSLTSCVLATSPDPGLGIAMALAAGAAVGLLNGWGVAVAGVHPLVMTLSTATFVQGLNHAVLPIPGGHVPPLLRTLSTTSVDGWPAPLMWCAVAIAGLVWVTGRSRAGLHLYAVGGNPRSAFLNGVDARRIVMTAYTGCSLMAVVSGVYLTGRVGAGDATLGAAFALESIAAVALGGVHLTGGVGGVQHVVLGTLSLGLMANGLNLFGVSPFMRGVLTGALLLLAVSLQRRPNVGM